MKIQNMAIILVIIILPITLVLSAYTKTQIDTIAVQTLYATKLRDATHDAVTAFQLNTTQNLYSTVSDSMRRDISAAIQTFIANLAKNLGMSGATENAIKPYIPAIVFTLYDGFYIYSPSNNYDNLNKSITNQNESSDYSFIGSTKLETDENKKYTYVDKFGDEHKADMIVSEYNEQLPSEEVVDLFKGNPNENATYGHVLKPYIYYAVRYVNNEAGIDVVVNYSLDNYIVIYGHVGTDVEGADSTGYITKAGYLVLDNPEINEQETLTRRLPVRTITFTDNKENKSMINDIATFDIRINKVEITNSYLKDVQDNGDLSDRLSNGISPFMEDVHETIDYGKGSVPINGKEDTIHLDKSTIEKIPDLRKKYINKSTGQAKEGDYNFGWHIGEGDDDKSETYYIDPESAKKFYYGVEGKEEGAIAFTKWVVDNLGNTINASHAVKLDGEKYEDKNGNNIFSPNDKIFDINTENDPNDAGSVFNEHKRNIIKLSIQDNLAQAIASYNEKSMDINNVGYNFQLPEIAENEWDQVLKNVCMITFFQGIQAGTKIFNDYSIVTSTKNKEYVSEDSLYFINPGLKEGEDPGYGKYHKIGCQYLTNGTSDNIIGYRNTDFDRYSYKYEVFGDDKKDGNGKLRTTYDDKVEYYYMHDEHEACYYCMVNTTPEGDKYRDNWKTIPDRARARAFYTAMAREKYSFYKTNEYLNGEKGDTTMVINPAH